MPASAGIFWVRPAWARTCGCKSRCELVTVSKVKRNCARVTERGEEAWSVNRELMNKNRIEGAAEQGEWAKDHEALVTKARWRRWGGCAMKVCDAYLARIFHQYLREGYSVRFLGGIRSLVVPSNRQNAPLTDF
jgi:hypothetical protein